MITFFLEITAFLEQKVHYSGTILSDDLFLEIRIQARTKIGPEPMILELKIKISRRIFSYQ